jgi:hypothetical protein
MLVFFFLFVHFCSFAGGIRANLWATLQYVSIHPFNDLNGRMSRFISFLSNFGTQYDLAYPFISDLGKMLSYFSLCVCQFILIYFHLTIAKLLDLVTEPALYQALVDESSRLYKVFINDLFREMLRYDIFLSVSNLILVVTYSQTTSSEQESCRSRLLPVAVVLWAA